MSYSSFSFPPPVQGSIEFPLTHQLYPREWVGGWWESRDPGTPHILDKFEVYLADLGQLGAVASDRAPKLPKKRHRYAKGHSSVSLVPKRNSQAVAMRSELRPDVPLADHRVDYEEIDAQLMRAV
ncbi:hypothetical protein FRC06_002257 [Ceratobasidium sp. 370]|nr:hypothetical protein FRC06_002257 [Ceratobasidium sp. 370]